MKVFEGIAEPTGGIVDRDDLRTGKSVCQSVSELARKVRRDGDGYFYLATGAWPENTPSINLIEKWKTIG
ncbi:MAG: hypothetical protein DMF58_09900 [Acidobacteria bacterium]|nr:MAG: hypothetical protein DMF58_09900 [Acidobacteriota bacterium]